VTEGNRNEWKVKEWSIGEHVGWEIWEMATKQYFRCGPHLACSVSCMRASCAGGESDGPALAPSLHAA
jgi:hypothetical protein